MIEIKLSKLIGTHSGPVKVRRGGKTFYQQRRIGKKDVLSEFKAGLKNMDEGTLKSQIAIIEKDYPAVRVGLDHWYDNSDMKLFDSQLTGAFGMEIESSRLQESVTLDPELIEGYKKIYLVTQEYLSRIAPGGTTIINRGLGPDSYLEYKGLEVGKDIKIRQYNVSSWTNDYDTSLEFAEYDSDGGVIMETHISNKRIFMHPNCASDLSDDYGENEVIVMGGGIVATINQLCPPWE